MTQIEDKFGFATIIGTCPTSACSSGVCRVTAADSCDEKNTKYALTADAQCLMECKNGTYQKTAMCGKGIEVLTDNTHQRMRIYETLALLPESVLAGAWRKVIRQTWLPEIDYNFEQKMKLAGIAGDYVDLSFQAPDDPFSPELVVHEYMHEWAFSQVAVVPTWAPFSDLVNAGAWAVTNAKNMGWAPAPASYVEAIGCKKNQSDLTYNEGETYTYVAKPITGYGYGGDKIPCGEDFADSAAWYVTRACDLLAGGGPESETKDPEAGKIRYEYMKEQIFEGKEYLPSGGCTPQ